MRGERGADGGEVHIEAGKLPCSDGQDVVGEGRDTAFKGERKRVAVGEGHRTRYRGEGDLGGVRVVQRDLVLDAVDAHRSSERPVQGLEHCLALGDLRIYRALPGGEETTRRGPNGDPLSRAGPLKPERGEVEDDHRGGRGARRGAAHTAHGDRCGRSGIRGRATGSPARTRMAGADPDGECPEPSRVRPSGRAGVAVRRGGRGDVVADTGTGTYHVERAQFPP